MRYAVIAFSARTQTINFNNILKSYNIYSRLINTPRSISSSCGTSIRIDVSQISRAKEILFRRNYPNFEGIYIISFEGSRELAQKVV